MASSTQRAQPTIQRKAKRVKSLSTSTTDVGSDLETSRLSRLENASFVSRISESFVRSFSSSVTEEPYTENVVGPIYEEYFANLKINKYSEFVWNHHKPLDKNSLYAKVLTDPCSIPETVDELLLVYKSNRNKATLDLMKFFVDVCGFQKFDLHSNFNFDTGEFSEILNKMQSNDCVKQHEAVKIGKYLLRETTTKSSNALKKSVYYFIHTLILSLHEEKILYDEFFYKHFLIFIREMCCSEFRSIAHTGGVFAAKILTGFVTIFKNLKYQAEGEFKTEIQTKLSKFIMMFHLIIHKTSRWIDDAVELMKVEYLVEMCIWIYYMPEIFVEDLQIIQTLTKLVIHNSSKVRMAAMDTCKFIVATFLFTHASFKPKIPQFVKAVSGRFYDTDIKIAVKAIDIFLMMVKENYVLTEEQSKMLVLLTFDKYSPVGKAACRFQAILSALLPNDELKKTLLHFAQLAEMDHVGAKEFLVEGALSISPTNSVFKCWELYGKILLNDDNSLALRKDLCKFFVEAVSQTLKGKPTIFRKMAGKELQVEPVEHVNVAKNFPTILLLLQKYRNQPVFLQELLKIFPLINGNNLTQRNQQYYNDFCDLLKEIFFKSDDKKILDKIAECLKHFCNIFICKRRAEDIVSSIAEDYSEDLKSFLMQSSNKTCEAALKISVLFSKFNISHLFNWKHIYDSWGNVNHLTAEYLISCCKSYLIWKLREIIEKTGTSGEWDLLSSLCNEFIFTSFNMLKNLNGEDLHFQVYISLCELHSTFDQDLREIINKNKNFSKLQLIIDSSLSTDVLVGFLEKYIIENVNLPLPKRRLFLTHYINLCHRGVLKKEIVHVYKYYHLYNKEFGYYIEQSLKMASKVKNSSIFIILIVHTLNIFYEQILDKYGQVNIRCEEMVQLKLLTKQFANFDPLRRSTSNVNKILLIMINNSVKNAQMYPFINLANYFVPLITDDIKLEMLEYLQKNVPEEARKNDVFLNFANTLKIIETPPKRRNNEVQSTAKRTAPTSKEKPKGSSANKESTGLGTSTKKSTPKRKAGPIGTPAKKKSRRMLAFSTTNPNISEEPLEIEDSDSD